MTTRYPRTIVLLHWLTALLIIAAYVTSEGGRRMRADPAMLHFALGLSVLVLTVPRLIARFTQRLPGPTRQTPPLMAKAAGLGHALLYLLLIGLPLTGWYSASRMGIALDWGFFSLPAIATATDGPAGIVAEIHETAGNVILYLAGAHALIAIWHHVVMRDGTLSRMSPHA
ncbi:cytochrome b [Acetobacteraceae bacterium H6797]|nr:cytochrome b [Acetobacteraceae bacterium H6797]